MQDYFKYDKIQTGTSLFMKSDSDGSKDKQDAAQAIGIRGSLDGTSSGAVGISHFTEFSDSANSIDKNKGLRFDDLQPNSLTFKYNYRLAQRVEVKNISEDYAQRAFGRYGDDFDEVYLHKVRPTVANQYTSNEFIDKWDINDINIIDDIAFVSYDKYTDLHRSEYTFSSINARQHFTLELGPRGELHYDYFLPGDASISLTGGIVLQTSELEKNPAVYYNSRPTASQPTRDTGAALSNDFMCYDNCILEATIDGKKLYFTYDPKPGQFSSVFTRTAQNRNGLWHEPFRFVDEKDNSNVKYTNIADLEDGSWGGNFRLIPNNPINGLEDNAAYDPDYERNTETTFSVTGTKNKYFELSIRKFAPAYRGGRLQHPDAAGFGGQTWHTEDHPNGGSTSYKYKDVSVKDVKLIKIQPVRKCGKVDIYVRKRGIITAVVGNRITSPGHGLSDNNIIKISSALFDGTENGIVDIHPMNGEKFVKRIDDDTFDLYEDQYFTNPTTTSKLRTTDGIAWACMSSSNNEFGQSWDYYKTMFSPTGKNGYASATAANMATVGNIDTPLDGFTTTKRVGAVKGSVHNSDDNVSGLQIDFSHFARSTFFGAGAVKGVDNQGNVEIKPFHLVNANRINENTQAIKSILENIPVSNVGSKSFLDITYAAPEDFYPFNPVDDQAIADDYGIFSPYTGCRFGADLDVKFSGTSGTSKKYTIAIGEPGSDVSVDYFGRSDNPALGTFGFDLTEDRRGFNSEVISNFRPRLIPPSLVHGKVHIIEMTVDQYGKITNLEHKFSKMGNGQTVGQGRQASMQEFPWNDFMTSNGSTGYLQIFSNFDRNNSSTNKTGPDFSKLMCYRNELALQRGAFREGRIHGEPNLYWDQAAAAHWFGTNILDYFQQKDFTQEEAVDRNAIEATFIVTVAPGINQFGEGNKYYLQRASQPQSTPQLNFNSKPRLSEIGLSKGFRYRFDLSDPSNAGHPFRFSTSANGSHAGGNTIGGAGQDVFGTDGNRVYTYYVGEPGTPGAFAERLISDNNQQLHYFCANHSGMGGQVNKATRRDMSLPVGRGSARRNFHATNSNDGASRSRFGEQGSGNRAKTFPRIDRFADCKDYGQKGRYGRNSVDGEGQWYVCPWVDSFGKSVALHDLNTGTTAEHKFLLLAGCTLLLGGAQSPASSNYSRQSTDYYRRPVLFSKNTTGRSYEAQNYDAVPKIGGIRSFRLEPPNFFTLLQNSNMLRHSAGTTNMNKHIATSAAGDGKYTALGEGESKLHPTYSAGKGVGQVSNSLHLSCSKILVKDNYLFWTEHYLGSSKSVIYMQEIGQNTGTNVTTITNSFDAVIRDHFNYKTNSIEANSEYATNGFGFDIKYEDGLLATNCLSTVNDFGEQVQPHDGIMLYEFDKNLGGFTYIQRFTPSFNSLDTDKYTERLLIDYNDVILDINNITYEGDAHGSRTWNTRLVDKYEIVNGKILLRDPIEFVIFAKDFSVDSFTYEDKHGPLATTNIFPYLAFTEHFTNNNVYYDYSAKSEFVVQDKNRWQISGINTIQNVENIVSTPVFFLDVLSSDIDNYGDLTVTIEIDESGENFLSTINKQLDSLTEIVDNNNAKIPRLILYGKDPRSMIVPNGPISAATNDEITPFTNGIFDYQPGTLSTSDPYYDKTITQPPLFRGGAHDLYFYGSLAGYGVRDYIKYGQTSYSDPNASYPFARKITTDTAALSPDKDFTACHYGGDKTLGELFDATYNQAGYTNRGIISFATIDGKISGQRLQSDGTLSPSEYNYLTPYAALFSDVATPSSNTYTFTIPYEAWRQYAFKGSFIKSSADNRPMFSDFTRISHGTLSSLSPFSGTWSQSYDDVNRPSYNPKRVLQNGSLNDVPPKFTLAIGFVNTSVTNVDIGNNNITTGSFGLSAGRNFRNTQNMLGNGVGSKMPYSIILSDKLSQPDPNLYPVRDNFISHSFVTTIKSLEVEISRSSLNKRRYKGVYNKIAYFKYDNTVSVDGYAFGNSSFSPLPIGLAKSSLDQLPLLDIPGYATSSYYGQSYSSVFGVGKSSAPAHNMTMGSDGTFNKSTQILTSDSIIAFGDSSKIVANYYFDDDSDSLYYSLPPTGSALGGEAFAGNTLLGGFDVNEPNFLSLSIFATPGKNNQLDAFTQGMLINSGDTTLSARGIDSFRETATLWVGKKLMNTGETLNVRGPSIDNFTSLNIEEVMPTKDMSLNIRPPFPVEMNLVIGQPIATGITTLFVLPPIQNTGDATLSTQGSALFAGQQTLATSGIGIKKGFMPIEIEGVFFKDGQMSLHAGNIKGSGDTTLQTRGHVVVSGVAPLNVRSIGSFNANTTAHIGTQYDLKNNDMSLAIKDTERPLNKDTTLNVDGKITSISSLTHGEQNYTVARNRQPVDISPTSVELPVSLYYHSSYTSSNSIVNRTIGESNGSSEIITNSSREYFGAGSTNGGLFVPSRLVENPKVSVAEKTRASASNSSGTAFYADGFNFERSDEILKREAYDSNGKNMIIGNSDGSHGRSSINIYDIVDGNSVQFKSKIQLDLGTIIPETENNSYIFETLEVKVKRVDGKNLYFVNNSRDGIFIPRGKNIRFDVSDPSNTGHPLNFSLVMDGTHGGGQQINLISRSGVGGTPNSYVDLTVPSDSSVFIYCSNHAGMGFGLNTYQMIEFANGTESSPFGDSFVDIRKDIKNSFTGSFENTDIDINFSESVIYDLKISKLGQIAASIRVRVSYSNTETTEERTFNVIVLFNVSSIIQGSSSIRAGLPTYYTTSYKHNILEESGSGSSKHSSGYTIAFDDEDLYFDRRSGQWGQVWKLSQSNDYSQATQVIDYGSHPDALNYVSASNGIYISDENKKAAFGVPIKIYDDYNSSDKLMFIGAHLFDPYVLNTLSSPHTPNAIGAVYIYRRALNSTNWTYFGAVYGKGNTSSNINTNLSQYKDSSLSNKQYGLFGYDFDYSEGNLVVSEPGGNGSESVNVGRAYLFEIGNSTITLSKTYLASDISLPSRDRDDHSNSSTGKLYSNIGKTSNFGSHIILLNGDNPITFSDTEFGNGVLHSLKSNDTIKSSTQYLKSSYTVGKWGATLNAAISNIRNEVVPYEPPQISDYASNLITTSYFVNSIKVLNFGQNQKKIGIIRRFATRLKAPADTSYEYNLDKLFLQDLRQEAFTLFVSGPEAQNNSIDLAMPTIARPSGDTTLFINPSPVADSGNMNLVMYNSTQSKTMPLHIETVRNNYIPISISGVGGGLSKGISLQVTPIPVAVGEQSLYMSGLGINSSSSTAFIQGLGQPNTVNFASLFIGKEINANDKMSLYTVADTATEAGYSKYADINTISIDGTNASGINTQSTLSVKGPSFGTTTNSATVSISTPIPEIADSTFYLHSGIMPIVVSGSNAANTFITDESFATLSVVASIQTTQIASLYMERPFANAASLFVKNLNPTGVVTTVVSGANIVSGVAPLFVKPNELFTTELFVRGYLE